MQHRQKILFPASSVLLFVLLCGGNANLLHEKENIKDHVFCANLNEEAPANRVTYESNDISGCGINLRGSNNIIDEKKESDALVQTQRAIRKKKNKKNKKNNKKEEKNTKDKQNKNKNDENDNEIISDKNPGSKSSKKSKNPQTAKTSKSSTMVACFNEERVECGINNKIYVCRYDKYEDIYTTDCLGEDKVSLLLSRNERDYCGICKPTEKVLCFEGTRAECGNDMVYTCHYDEAQGVHTNFCVAEDDLLNHLSENQKDYYGICKETTFVENSVFRSVPDANGHETQGIYEIEYDGSFNEDGIIDLSKSFDIIDAISCSPGSVEILFTNPIPTASLSEMFPQGAILVVNGDLFGVSCNVFAAYDGDRSPTSNDGFLVVGESQGEGPLVTVSGIPAIFEMLFRDLSLKFSIDSTSDGGEGRKLVKLEDNIPPFNVVLPPDGPIQLLASVDISGRAYIKNFNYHVSAVKGDSWYEIYPQIDASVELGYDAEIKLAGGIKMTPTYDFQLFKVAFDTIKISLAEIGIPDGILNGVLSSSKLKVGLSLQMPIEVSIDMKSTFSSEVRYDSTIVLGEKRGLVHISGNPLKPWNMMPIWESIEIEEPNAAGNLSPEENGELSLLASSDAPVLSAVANFVFKPQIRLSFFDAAYVGAGNYFRLESVSVYRSYPFPPKNNGYKCEGCHSAVSKLAVVLQDFVLVYRNLISGDPDSETPLDPFAKKVELLDICLLGLVDNIPCGTSCCNPTDVCEDNVCTAEPCLLECCSNDHCISPKTCNSIGECDCPYECCEDLDCTGDAICDSVTHRCRSDEIEIGDRPFKILHLGDSYSAGTGARFYDDPMGCYRSKKNWGSRFAELMGGKGRAVTYINRACNGGVMNHFYNKRLLSTDVVPCRPSLLDEIISEDDTDCYRYVKHQKASVSEDMDVVLLTMGGNDLKFADVVMNCFVAGSLSPAGCRETVYGADELLLQYRESMKVILNDTANGIKPGGTVILSSYPYLVTDAAYIIESFKDRFDAGTAIRDLADRFDDEQRLAVQEVNQANAAKLAQVPPASGRVLYFDGTKGLFAAHEPDPGLFGVNKRSWVNDLLQPAGDFNEWYHPNADGHRAWGDAVFRFFENMDASGEGSGSDHQGSNNLDLVFVIDATGSMSGAISSVKAKMKDIVDQIVASSQSYRIGIVTYKDFPSAGGSFGDYPSLVELDFSNDLAEIQSAISGIHVSGGGDSAETVLSGINTAFDMDWRPGVTKVTIVMGDAPAKIGDDGAEPISGLTPDQLIAKSAALDPVGVTVLELGDLATSESPVARISIGTGGSVVSGDDGVVAAIEGILEGVSKQPFAWFGESVVGKVGEALVFDARGSFDPYGSKISTYQWDFDGDGVYDVSSGEALVSHVYTDPFDGIVVLRVSSSGGQGLASAHVVVNARGSISQSHEDVCEMDEETGLPIVKDANGIPLLCSVNSTMWPTENREGVTVVTDREQTRALAERCVQFLGSEIVEYEECDVQNRVWETKRKMTAGYLGLACESIDDILFVFQHEVGYSKNACLKLCRGVIS